MVAATAAAADVSQSSSELLSPALIELIWNSRCRLLSRSAFSSRSTTTSALPSHVSPLTAKFFAVATYLLGSVDFWASDNLLSDPIPQRLRLDVTQTIDFTVVG
ncbi:hypothetical protein L2E82_00878 [Cichorium intybus]|uniref:Uncharacterized protein n=1 Tax=Cichorium intybus TaxID=13427 RepID=A0ACB9GXI2_CICIN|nr:hypothetical protein L2E82_00878 [Cichorium intybus]